MPPATIYGLIDPLSNELRYVGKTTGPLNTRLRGHVNDVARGRVYIPRHKWIDALLRAGCRPSIVELETVPGDEWEEAEKFWVAYCRFIGCRLLNATAGGDGLASYRHTESTRQKQAIAAKARYQREGEKAKTGEAVRQALSTPAARENLRNSKLNVPSESYDHFRKWARSEENIIRVTKMCKARAGTPMSEDARKKLSVAMTGKKRSPESVEKTAASLRGRKRAPSVGERISASLRAHYANRNQKGSTEHG